MHARQCRIKTSGDDPGEDHPSGLRARDDRDADRAVSGEPTTLVELTLEDTDGGTVLTIVESGFDRIPLARRAEAFRMNEQGSAREINNLARYVS